MVDFFWGVPCGPRRGNIISPPLPHQHHLAFDNLYRTINEAESH